MMSMFDVSAETDNVSAEMPSFTITYNESEVVDDNKYGYGDYAEIQEFEGEIPEDMVFVNWIDQDENKLLPGDEIEVVSNLELSPVFELDMLGTVSGGDSMPLDEEESLLDKEESTLEEESNLDNEDETVSSDDDETAVTKQDETSEESMDDVEESDSDNSEESISIEDDDITEEDDSESMTESDDGSSFESEESK